MAMRPVSAKRPAAKRPAAARRAQERDWLAHVAGLSPTELFAEFETAKAGLTAEQVELSRERRGANSVISVRVEPTAIRFLKSFADPFTAILMLLVVTSIMTDVVFAPPTERAFATPLIIFAMVLISGTMRFVQETKSGNAVAALTRMIQTTCNVERQGVGRREVPLDELVVGDIVHLSAGDTIPADLRIISSRDLFVNESSLTGESAPVEKRSRLTEDDEGATRLNTIAYLGSDVVSGVGVGVVILVGEKTTFGRMSSVVGTGGRTTSFDRGIAATSRLLIRFMALTAPFVLLVNGITKGNWLDAVLFALSIAVGLTPEMLPMLVTTCLAKGAIEMGEHKVIVKRLDAIQNLGSIDILCTDKTGTLTQDNVVLERHLNVMGEDDNRVLACAFVNSYFETGLRNLIDSAIIERASEVCGTEDDVDVHGNVMPSADELSEKYELVDELPFDFDRRRVTVLVNEVAAGRTLMISKGAIEEILSVCDRVEYHGEVVSLDEESVEHVREGAADLAAQGMRVLGVATRRDVRPDPDLDAGDERGMTLIGYLAFLDPPKDSAAAAIGMLADHGVTTKVLTGDSALVARHVCDIIGIPTEDVLTGDEVEAMGDEELAARVERASIFAKLAPDQKARVVQTLRELGHSVGYMGDGVNDAAAMDASDCGISVDSAVDVAKETADIILLEKDLLVLEEGLVCGRKTYANMIKYVKMTASSNFGNIFAILAASVLLPFLPMTAAQLLLLNLINDICCIAMPWDRVDEEFLVEPCEWNTASISSFMRWMGPVSSVFDLVTFALLFFVVCPEACGGTWSAALGEGQRTLFVATFQAGWFVESMVTQMLVVQMLRTPHVPFVQSRASVQVILAGLGAIAAAVLLTFSPLAEALDFSPLPMSYFWMLLLIAAGYMALASVVKGVYVRRYGRLL